MMNIPVLTQAGRDPRDATDAIRPTAKVARSENGDWVVLGHAEALEVANDPHTYSSAVGSHLHIPNGLDGEEHTKFRALIERYMTPEKVAELEPEMTDLAEEIVAGLERNHKYDAVGEIGATFAARAAQVWLGWDDAVVPRILEWVGANRAASRSGDRSTLAEVAEQFDAIVTSQVEPRLEHAGDDVTSQLIHDDSLGRPLRKEEIVSILRNWTGGDISSVALCLGVIVEGLASCPALHDRVRKGSDTEVDAIIDELLRLDSPFVSNRRKATCPVTLAGAEIAEGERVHIHWTSANRDSRVFSPGFNADNRPDNFVWGSGPHVCPGRDLATMELRVMTRALAKAFDSIEVCPGATREVAPVGGWESLPVMFA